MNRKKLIKVIACLSSMFSLCSFTSSDTNSPLSHYSLANNGEQFNSVNQWDVGTTKQIDLGRRNWPIGQELDLTLNSYTKYDATAKQGYIYDYDTVFVNPKGFKNDTIRFETIVSETYGYSYTTEMEAELSDSFNLALQFDFLKAESGMTTKISSSVAQTFSYAFGITKSISKEYDINLSAIPDGYVFTLCYVCTASIVNFDLVVKNNYWWGKVPSGPGPENFTGKEEIFYDASSMFLTLGIKKEGESGGPRYYLNA